MKIGLGLWLGNRRAGGGGPQPPARRSQFGMNQTTISYYIGNRPYVNMAKQEQWRTSTGGVQGYEANSAYVDKHGDIIAMRAGATYTKYMGRSGPNTSYKYRATWTGAGVIQGVNAAMRVTISGATLVSPNVYEWTATYDSDPEVTGWFSINFANTAAVNPVVGLDVREIDANGDYIEPLATKFHGPWLALQAGRGVLRFMDWLNINAYGGTNNTSSWTPMDWADRTPVDCLMPGLYNTPATLVVGSGTSKLTFTAVEAMVYGTVDAPTLMNGLVSSGMKTATGAEGNNVTVEVEAASGSGSITVSYVSGKIAIKVVPASGASTANAIAAQITASKEASSWITAISGGAGAVSTFGPTALSGGAYAQNPNGFPIEDLVEICNLTNCDFHYNFQPRHSDDYVTGALTYIRDNLNPNLKLYIELSNEVWNMAGGYVAQQVWFAALGIYANGAPAYPATDWYMPFYGYAYRYRQIMVIAESIFSGARSRLVRSLTALQLANTAALVNFLKSPADGGIAALYVGDHVDEALTAPYWGDNIFDPVNARMKGAWTTGMALVQFDYVYYAANSTLYFATEAHTSSFASPDLDPQLLPLTAANLEPYIYASMDAVLNLSKTAIADVAATYTNDLDNPIRYGSYEGGPSMSIGDPGGAGTAITQTAITAFYTDPLFATWEGVFLSEYRQRFGEDAIFRIFAAANGPWAFNFNFAIQTADWSLDAVAPRAVGFRNALADKFPTYWWLSEPTISGEMYIGEILTANVGTIRNANSTAIQWTRDGVAISGATDATYTIAAADDGHVLNFTVTAPGDLNIATASSTNTTAAAPPVKFFALTAASGTFEVPADCNGDIIFHLFGESGSSVLGTSATGQANAGGGGEYRRKALTGLSGSISYQIGQGGTGNATWVGSSSTAKANGGTNASTTAAGLGGTGGIGDLGYDGGDGGSAVAGNTYACGGGGGCAGPNGPGADGNCPNTRGGGGGGANGGSVGTVDPISGNSNGGNNRHGTGGGVAGVNGASNGGNGTGGGGGGGYSSNLGFIAGNGSDDLCFKGIGIGPGGGGGGGGYDVSGGVHSGAGGHGGAPGASLLSSTYIIAPPSPGFIVGEYTPI